MLGLQRTQCRSLLLAMTIQLSSSQQEVLGKVRLVTVVMSAKLATGEQYC